MSFSEINFDGLIGPTHNYAGLSFGNLASQKHHQKPSFPKQAALQGLEKMRTLLRLGYQQGFFLPQERPRIDILNNLGFSGDIPTLLNQVSKRHPELLSMVYSASSMWAANAATVTPSPDSEDGRVHFTPANLLTTAHRIIEQQESLQCLNTVFADSKYFCVHEPLLSHSNFADEGAANHTRLCNQYDQQGVGLFVYGRESQGQTERFPARQTLNASQAIARAHHVKHPAFLLQNPKAIDAGAFHNDVVAVGNGPALFFHEMAFAPTQQETLFTALKAAIDFKPLCVKNSEVSLDTAISSYLFNSQLLASPQGNMASMRLIAPTECQESPEVSAYLDNLIQQEDQPINALTYVDVRQSMSNGGGPACLRLRVCLSEAQVQAVNPAFMLSEEKIDLLATVVKEHYRDELTPRDLADPDFFYESRATLEKLTDTLGIGHYYQFQQ